MAAPPPFLGPPIVYIPPIQGQWISSYVSPVNPNSTLHWYFNPTPSVAGLQRNTAFQPTLNGALTYRLQNNYTFKHTKMYQYEIEIKGNLTGVGFSASFVPKNSTIFPGDTNRIHPSTGVNAGTAGGRYYFYNSPPSTQVTQNTLWIYATGSFSGSLGTGLSPRITNLKLNELDWFISGYKKFIPGVGPTQGAIYWETLIPGEYRKYNGWSFEKDIKTFWWSYRSTALISSGGLETNNNVLTNYIRKKVPFSTYNLSFEYLTVGGFATESCIKIYQLPSNVSLSTAILNPLTYPATYTLTQSQYTTQSTYHQVYGLQGNGPSLYIVGQVTTNASGMMAGIINPVITGGYSTNNNRQFLFSNGSSYSNPTTLQILGATFGMTYSYIVGSGSTIAGTPSNLSLVSSLVGNGEFIAGVWENGVWNSGWRIDTEVFTFDDVGVAFKTIADRRWRIQIVGPTLSVAQFEIGDRVSIGNIVAIDINESRKLLKGYFTIINKSDSSLIVETDVSFPFRRIEKDSPNHKINMTKNVWLSGAFLNGYFTGIWNYGLFKGHPYITEMFDTHWIDGIFDGGHFNSVYESFTFNNTINVTASNFGLDSSYNGKLGLSFSAPGHTFVIGDVIDINKNNKLVNISYDGTASVKYVVDKYLLITDKNYGSASGTESGLVSNTKANGVIQNFSFVDNNIASKTSPQSPDGPDDVFQFRSWIDVNYINTEAVNIGKTTRLYDTSMGTEYSQNNLYGYPTNDVLSSISTFRDSYSFTSRNYKLGTKYKVYQDGIGRSSEFNRPFNTTDIGLDAFFEDGWTYSGTHSLYERSSEDTNWNQDVPDDYQIIGEELQITSTMSGSILNNQNISIENSRYTIVELDVITFSTFGTYSSGTTSNINLRYIDSDTTTIGSGEPIPSLHFNNINQYKFTEYINFGFGPVPFITYLPMKYIPVYSDVYNRYGSSNVNLLSTSKLKKYEYFFNKPTLSMKTLGNDELIGLTPSTYNGTHTTQITMDNLKYYEVDMIPFFQYFVTSNIYSGIAVPWQGIAPFIDYTKSNFSFIDNISIGLGSIQTQQSFTPVSGVGIGIGGGFTVNPIGEVVFIGGSA